MEIMLKRCQHVESTLDLDFWVLGRTMPPKKSGFPGHPLKGPHSDLSEPFQRFFAHAQRSGSGVPGPVPFTLKGVRQSTRFATDSWYYWTKWKQPTSDYSWSIQHESFICDGLYQTMVIKQLPTSVAYVYSEELRQVEVSHTFVDALRSRFENILPDWKEATDTNSHLETQFISAQNQPQYRHRS